MTFDKELLFKERLPQEEIEIPGVGTVTVRGLNREEAFKCQGGADVATIERRMLAMGMVDPKLTENEVKRWQKAAPAGELEPIAEKISELSGMTQGAAKEAYVAFEENPDAEFRALPSGEAVDDGGPPPG